MMKISLFGLFDIGYSICLTDEEKKIQKHINNQLYDSISFIKDKKDKDNAPLTMGLYVQTGYGVLIDVTKKEIDISWRDCYLKYISSLDFISRANKPKFDYSQLEIICNEKTYIHMFGFGVCILEKTFDIDENLYEEALDITTGFEYSSYSINDNSRLISSIDKTLKKILYDKENKIIMINKELKIVSERSSFPTEDPFLSYSIVICSMRKKGKKLEKFILKYYDTKSVVKNGTHEIFAGWHATMILCDDNSQLEDLFEYYKLVAKYFVYIYGLCHFLYSYVGKINLQLVNREIHTTKSKRIKYDLAKKTRSFLQLVYLATNYQVIITNEDILKMYDYYERSVNTRDQRDEMLSTINELINVIQTTNQEKTTMATIILTIIGSVFAGLSTISSIDEIRQFIGHFFN